MTFWSQTPPLADFSGSPIRRTAADPPLPRSRSIVEYLQCILDNYTTVSHRYYYMDCTSTASPEPTTSTVHVQLTARTALHRQDPWIFTHWHSPLLSKPHPISSSVSAVHRPAGVDQAGPPRSSGGLLVGLVSYRTVRLDPEEFFPIFFPVLLLLHLLFSSLFFFPIMFI